MISNKTRETRKGRVPKLSRNLERLYKEGKCSECSVVVTKMDFARILGKFTKVKIQYQTSSAPKTRKENQQITSPNSRLKNNENGMVLIHRNAYNKHPVNSTKKPKPKEKPTVPRGKAETPRNKALDTPRNKALDTPRNKALDTPRNKALDTPHNKASDTPQNKRPDTPRNKALDSPRGNNILKENNRLKKSPNVKEKLINSFVDNLVKSYPKQYGIIFVNPKGKNENIRSKISLQNLLPSIDKSILPSNDWYIDYLPKQGEPKEDKVYDRIAAELEDLMNSEKSPVKSDAPKLESKSESSENKDDFPSIMDILNDNTIGIHANDQSNSAVQTNLESSDVEAMLLGKSSEVPSTETKLSEITPMDVDTDISSLLNVAPENSSNIQNNSDTMDNPNSPSILDEALEKGLEEHLPKEPLEQKNGTGAQDSIKSIDTVNNKKKENDAEVNYKTVTHVVFKKISRGVCCKSVTCPKNLKYSVELEGKSVQFLGAPKFVTSLEDLIVLLQIVNETESDSIYVL